MFAKKVSDSVLEEIRRRILDGELRQGDKLPSQDKLAAAMGVSRSTFREALRSLSLMEAFAQRPGLGTVIKQRANALLAGNINHTSAASRFSFYDLFEARHLLEADLIELAAARIDAYQLQLLSQSLYHTYLTIKGSRLDDFYQEGLAFHILSPSFP